MATRYLKITMGRLLWIALAILILVAVSPIFLGGGEPVRQGGLGARGKCGYRAEALGFKSVDCREVERQQAHKMDAEIGLPLYTFETVKASTEIGQMLLISGEKSVVAGQGEFMSAAMVEDRQGNTVPDGTPIDFIFDGTLAARAMTKGGVAHTRFRAPIQAGTVEIAAKINNIVAMGNVIRVVPAEPVALEVQRSHGSGPVNDGEEIWFETSPMKDQFGNRLDDGALVTFAGKDSSGRKVLLQGVVVNGIATAKIINRHIDGQIELIGHHKDIVGPMISAEFEPVDFPDVLESYLSSKRGMVNLEVGPLSDNLNRFVKDGMPFELVLPDGRKLEEATNSGYLKFMFTNSDPDRAMKVILCAGDEKWALEIFGNKEGAVKFVAPDAKVNKGRQS